MGVRALPLPPSFVLHLYRLSPRPLAPYLHWLILVPLGPPLEVLRRCGAQVARQNSAGHTAFHLAAAEGRLAVLTELVTSTSDLHVLDSEMKTLLHVAAEAGQTEVVLFPLLRWKPHPDSLLDDSFLSPGLPIPPPERCRLGSGGRKFVHPTPPGCPSWAGGGS